MASAASLFLSVPELAPACEIVKQHMERFDGQGFPAKRRGSDILLGARVLRSCIEYLRATSMPSGAASADAVLVGLKGSVCDPVAVDAVFAALGVKPAAVKARPIPAASLAPGMKLAKDLLTPEGHLLLAKNQTLTENQVRHLLSLDPRKLRTLEIWIFDSA